MTSISIAKTTRSNLRGVGGSLSSDVVLFFQQSDGTATMTFGPDANVVLTVSQPSPYNATYTVTPTDATNLPHLGKAPVITGAATRNEGDTLVKQSGLWVADNASGQSIATEWLRGGAPISGATGDTYVVTGADGGTTITCRETVGGETSTSNGITIASGAKTVTFVDGQYQSVNNNSAHIFTPDMTGVATGATLLIGCAVRYSILGDGTFSCSLGANSATLLQKSNETLSRPKVMWFRVTHPGGTPSLSFNETSGTGRLERSSFAMFAVTGGVSSVVTQNNFAGNSISSQSLNLNTTSGNLLIVAAATDGANGQNLAVTGAGTVAYSQQDATNSFASAYHAIVLASSETPRSVSTTWTANTAAAGVSITI